MSDKNNIPRHIAIIMDGNGRWARLRRLPKIEGHRAGVNAVEEIIQACKDLGVEVLSLYTFSTENWQRPKKEVKALMGLLQHYLKKYLQRLKKNRVRLMVSGQISRLPQGLQQQLKQAMLETNKDYCLILNLALNYSGREEIVQAVKEIAEEARQNKIQTEDIDQELFSEHLYTKRLPDPDLVIRTSGEMRLSNFFLWQASYAELYFTPKLWPDFKKADLLEALSEFNRRQRRFGAR